MPGPLLTATLVSSAERGFWAGPQIVLGHALLEITLITALLAGASAVLVQPAVTAVISLAGGIFLVYLGGSMIRDVILGRLQVVHAKGAETSAAHVTMHPVLTGLLISVSNPFWSIWWATIGLGYLTLSLKSGIPGVAAFFSGHILADLSWYALVAAAVSKGGALLSPQLYKGILMACGLFLIGLGGYFFYSGL